MEDSGREDKGGTPKPKRRADDRAMAANYGQSAHSSASVAGGEAGMVQATSRRTTEGFTYGFILPFQVDKREYCVVKIGMTAPDRLIRRLRDHQKGFSNTTQVPIFRDIPLSATQNVEDFIQSFKRRKDPEVFLISRIKKGLKLAEMEAGLAIGEAPFTAAYKTFRDVFSEGKSRDVTTTEWFVARRKVMEDVQVAFWYNELDSFDTAADFAQKLKQLNKRKHVDLNISLETLVNRIYDSEVIKVPVYTNEET